MVGLFSAVVAVVAMVLGTAPAPSSATDAPELTASRVAAKRDVAPHRSRLGRAVSGRAEGLGDLHVPARTTFGADGEFDVVIHFHGGGLERQVRRAKVDAAVVVVNLGAGSKVYRRRLSSRPLQADLTAIEHAVRRATGIDNARIGRIALSSWSAGYGAIDAVLRRPADAARIDAVLIADGMHGALQRGRVVAEHVVAPYANFARLPGKLLHVTHTQIPTGDYASTAETGRRLVSALGLPRADGCARPRAMHLLACHGADSTHIASYAGSEPEDHMDHLRNMRRTTLKRLAKHWRR